jgi:peptide chain release factor 2
MQQIVQDLKEKLNIDEKKSQLADLESKMSDPNLWSNWEEGQKISKEVSRLKGEIEDFELLEMAASDQDEEAFNELYEKMKVQLFLSKPHDNTTAILTIRAGQGGTEACDWAEIISRMYAHFSEKKGWSMSLISEAKGEEAGIKQAVYEISGDYAYGLLKGEQGTHRLVRQSPFNSQSKRQTSFAAVEVIPEIDKNIEIEIKEADIEFSAFRSGGHGGQNVNKVSTAVRIKHLPSNIVVECQQERSQEQNRAKALQLLKSKLYAIKEQELKDKEAALRGEAVSGNWGTQIRSYVLHPYKMVKDLRTGVESTDPDKVLNGDLDAFIEAELSLVR